jgi:hypothetical protein
LGLFIFRRRQFGQPDGIGVQPRMVGQQCRDFRRSAATF